MDLSVIVPTHNPHRERLLRTLRGLRDQTLPAKQWEAIVIDNASDTPVLLDRNVAPANARVVTEPVLGLTSARRRGLREARSDVVVLVDDDNELAPNYLEEVLNAFRRFSQVGAVGGRSLPEFEPPGPDGWTQEFHPLLALRDLGPASIVSTGLRSAGAGCKRYPAFAPIGAGMALRRPAWEAWMHRGNPALSDRRGQDLSSGGDNDIVLCAMAAGWEVAYVPELTLTHLIPNSRLAPVYLARLNYGIQKSWMQVLRAHDANPWEPLTTVGARLRMIKAWLRHRPWQSAAAHIRWRGDCGHFAGRVPSPTLSPSSSTR